METSIQLYKCNNENIITLNMNHLIITGVITFTYYYIFNINKKIKNLEDTINNKLTLLELGMDNKIKDLEIRLKPPPK